MNSNLVLSLSCDSSYSLRLSLGVTIISRYSAFMMFTQYPLWLWILTSRFRCIWILLLAAPLSGVIIYRETPHAPLFVGSWDSLWLERVPGYHGTRPVGQKGGCVTWVGVYLRRSRSSIYFFRSSALECPRALQPSLRMRMRRHEHMIFVTRSSCSASCIAGFVCVLSPGQRRVKFTTRFPALLSRSPWFCLVIQWMNFISGVKGGSSEFCSGRMVNVDLDSLFCVFQNLETTLLFQRYSISWWGLSASVTYCAHYSTFNYILFDSLQCRMNTAWGITPRDHFCTGLSDSNHSSA